MVKLKRFYLRSPDEMEQFNTYFIEYLAEVCDEEEYQENICEMQDDELNSQMIAQTLRADNPYFIMKILLDGEYVGFISYAYNSKSCHGFINNLFVRNCFRRTGVGAKALMLAEANVKALGGTLMELVPVDGVEGFYLRNGYEAVRMNADHEAVYAKSL